MPVVGVVGVAVEFAIVTAPNRQYLIDRAGNPTDRVIGGQITTDREVVKGHRSIPIDNISKTSVCNQATVVVVQ